MQMSVVKPEMSNTFTYVTLCYLGPTYLYCIPDIGGSAGVLIGNT